MPNGGLTVFVKASFTAQFLYFRELLSRKVFTFA